MAGKAKLRSPTAWQRGNGGMFEIGFSESGDIAVSGRLDAAQAARAQEFLDALEGRCVIDMAQLEYVSSAGLGVLLRTHKRLIASKSGLELVNVNKHIADIFRYSGFDKLFKITSS
jgi:anti-anti-sigma factor